MSVMGSGRVGGLTEITLKIGKNNPHPHVLYRLPLAPCLPVLATHTDSTPPLAPFQVQDLCAMCRWFFILFLFHLFFFFFFLGPWQYAKNVLLHRNFFSILCFHPSTPPFSPLVLQPCPKIPNTPTPQLPLHDHIFLACHFPVVAKKQSKLFHLQTLRDKEAEIHLQFIF